jgi:hypothetical protein
MAKAWEFYGDASFCKRGIMLCSACGKPIVAGEFRSREKNDAYVNQHRMRSRDDPEWARRDDKAQADLLHRRAFVAAIIAKHAPPADAAVAQMREALQSIYSIASGLPRSRASTEVFRIAGAALAAGPADAVPDGWKLVPVEPTVKMVDAAGEIIVREYGESDWEEAKDMAEGLNPNPIYKAMLAAAPEPPR